MLRFVAAWCVVLLGAGCTASVSNATASSGSSAAASSSAGSASSSSSSSSSTGSSGATSTSGTSSSSSTSNSSSTSSSSGTTGTTTSGSTGLALGPSIDALVGINGFIDDPTGSLSAFGTVREYHDWNWNDGPGPDGGGYPDNQLQFSLWSGYWDWDAYYGALADAGVSVFPAVQGGVDYLGAGALPPVPTGADTTAAASYVAHGDFMFQIAARYGSVQVSDSLLRLAPGQVRTSGLGFVHAFENGNEPDNNWTRGGGAYLYQPAEFAAQCSADYDGDQGRLGATVGVKNADPSAKLVMGGLAMAGASDAVTNAESYLDGMRAWASANRGGDFPADVINIHHYCFGLSSGDPGQSPEDCGLAASMAAMVAYREQNLPGKELWLTELGYDTDPASPLRAPAIGTSSAEVVQAQWLVRSVLAAAEGGVDRLTIFVSRDGCTGDATACPDHAVQFTTSGVMTDKNSGFTPKPAFYFLATFRSALAGLRFAGPRSSGRSDVRIDAFADATGRGAYVVWAPSSSGATISGYALAVPGATQATELALVDQSTTGQSSALTLNAGAVSVDLSETPVVVRVDHVQ